MLIATAPEPWSQAARYWIPTETLFRSPSSVASPGVAATPGEATEDGLRNNVSVGIQYLAAWLQGSGAVAINNLMEDAATAEISRSQIWQWLHHNRFSADDVTRITGEEMGSLGAGYDEARTIFESIATRPDYVEFLTLPAYDQLVADEIEA